MNSSNKRKPIIKLAIIAIFLSSITTTVISICSLNSLINHNAQSLTRLLSSSILDAIRSEISKSYIVSRIISGDSLLVNLLRIEDSYPEDYIAYRLNTYLTGIRKNVDFSSAFFVPVVGRHLFGINALVKQLDPLNNKDDARYDAFISSGRPNSPMIQSDPFYVDRKMFFIFSRIAEDDGKVVGMCGIGFPLETIQSILDGFERQYDIKIHLINWDKKSMLSTDNSLSGIETIESLPDNYSLDRDFAYTENRNGGYTITRYLEEIGWFLVIKGERAEGKDAFTHLIIGNIVAIIVIFILLFLALHILMRSERTHLEYRAFTDELTGIANRAGFEAALKSRLRQDGEEGSIFLLDLDHFKEVNDNLGHPEGDALLKLTAQKLKALVRETDILARLGGDEFVLYFSGMRQFDTVSAKAEGIREALLKSYALPNGKKLIVSASIGIAFYPCHGKTSKSLYQSADRALYASKEGGRNRYTILQDSV